MGDIRLCNDFMITIQSNNGLSTANNINTNNSNRANGTINSTKSKITTPQLKFGFTNLKRYGYIYLSCI